MEIQGRNIGFTYDGESSPVFSGLDFTIRGPGFVSLFGLSGSGKSTLARIIGSELEASEGTVRITGASRILYSHNNERLPGWCSLENHLASVTPNGRARLLKRLSVEFGVENLLHGRFAGLSMGQKNRVNMLRYLVQDFDILIADEVLANVDEPTRNHILRIIKSTFPDRTFIYISHNAPEVAKFSRTVLVLGSAGNRSEITEISGLDLISDDSGARESLRKTALRLLELASVHDSAAMTPGRRQPSV